MGYYRIKISMKIPKNVVKDLMDKQKRNTKMVQSAFEVYYFVEEKNALRCYENAIKTLNGTLKGATVTVINENDFHNKIANIECLKYMQNAKKGDKLEIIPLYYLIDENRELHFEITKTNKEKYDKYIKRVKKTK